MPAVVLIDTNVWVSAFINPHGYPAKLKAAWTQNRFQAVISVTGSAGAQSDPYRQIASLSRSR